jgi:hypothetical protein
MFLSICLRCQGACRGAFRLEASGQRLCASPEDGDIGPYRDEARAKSKIVMCKGFVGDENASGFACVPDSANALLDGALDVFVAGVTEMAQSGGKI